MTLLMREQEKFEQGREKGITEVIVRMCENGFTMEQIALCTNKGTDEVKDILERKGLISV